MVQSSNPRGAVPLAAAYHELLGIPPAEQPPSYYRLLGLSPFESNATVIDRAADRQMKHLRDFKSGEHASTSQQLLNEISKARRTLLDDRQRAAYDNQLRAELSAAAQPAPVTAPVTAPVVHAAPNVPVEPASPLALVQRREPSRIATPRPTRLPAPRQPAADLTLPLLVVGGALAVLVVCGLLLWSPWSDSPTIARPVATAPAKKKPIDGAKPKTKTAATPTPAAVPTPTEFVPPRREPAAPSPPPAALTSAIVRHDGLRGYWPFDEVGPQAATDKSGNESHGVLAGGVQQSHGARQQAFHFDGSDDSIALGRPAALELTGQITLAAWIRPEAVDGFRNIVAQGFSTNPNGEIFLRLQDNHYYVGYYDGSTYAADYEMPADDLNHWVHLAGCYDGAEWKLYHNGKLVASAAGLGVTPVNGDWTIGAGVSGTERFFSGAIDEVRIYDRSLTAAEVAELAAPSNAGE